MTHATKRTRIGPALPAAALAALLLAGCSTGHIGESWQCPLAEGGSCGSVAAADPAVPDAGATDGTRLVEPLWLARGGEPGTQASAPPCAADCDGGFDPFGWLARLFAAETHDGETRPAGRAAETPSATPASAWPAEPATALLPAPGSGPGQARGPSQDEPEPDGPAAALRKAAEEDAGAALPAAAERVAGDPDDGDLRTGEVVARIWIAPFVDGNGVYREASHVRVVLEPAGWRLR